jgi:hypothetical protein
MERLFFSVTTGASMIPEGVNDHSPQLLVALLTEPPANHGGFLKGTTADAYRFLVEHRFLMQTELKVKKNSGRRVMITTALDHKPGKAADELRAYLDDLIANPPATAEEVVSTEEAVTAEE